MNQINNIKNNISKPDFLVNYYFTLTSVHFNLDESIDIHFTLDGPKPFPLAKFLIYFHNLQLKLLSWDEMDSFDFDTNITSYFEFKIENHKIKTLLFKNKNLNNMVLTNLLNKIFHFGIPKI